MLLWQVMTQINLETSNMEILVTLLDVLNMFLSWSGLKFSKRNVVWEHKILAPTLPVFKGLKRFIEFFLPILKKGSSIHLIIVMGIMLPI